MELELELELDSFGDDGSDNDQRPLSSSVPHHHRTVDEILLLNDFSSSSSSSSVAGSPSPPSSPSTIATWRHQLDYRQESSLIVDNSNNNISTVCSSDSLITNDDNNSNHNDFDAIKTSPTLKGLSHTHSLDPNNFQISASSSTTNNSSSWRRINSVDFASSRSVILPPLFAAVKSNVKPGAALAAAAAASRSFPTPHAAAIKSSRTSSSTAALSTITIFQNESKSTVAAASSATASALHSEPASDDTTKVDGGVFDEWYCLQSIIGGSESGAVVKETDNQVDDGRGQFSGPHDTVASRVHEIENLMTENAGELPTIETSHLEAPPSFVASNVDNQRIDDSSGATVEFHLPATAEMKYLDFHEISTTSEGDEQVRSSSMDEHDSNEEHSQFNSSKEIIPEETTPIVADPDREHFDEKNSGKIDEMLGQETVISQSNDEVLSLRGDDTSSDDGVSDIVQDVALQWKNKKDIRKTHIKSHHTSLTPLEVAEELEKKQAFTGMHWEEGAAAQPMRLEGVRRGSTVLGYFDVDLNNAITRTISSQAFRREHGFPSVLSVHLNYIAIGMSKGVILVMPSKYSPYHSDNMDSKMLMLGLQGERSYVPVTSMCFNQQGDLLFAGYADGHFSVWDVQRVSALRVVTEHKAPVVHMLYLGQDSQVSRQFNVVSGDSKGVVKLIRFSVVPWVNRISYSKAMKLLDETTSTVICASPLLSTECLGGALMSFQGSSSVTTSAIGSMMGGVIGGDSGWKSSSLVEDGVVIFVTHQSALVAKVCPAVEVYAQIPKPDGVGEGSMPYAAWRYMSDLRGSSTETVPVETSEKCSFLAIAWDRKVQVAKLVKSELKVHAKWTLDSPAVGVAWLDDQMLVVLTSIGRLGMFTKDGNMIHHTSFAVDGSGGDDLITYHTYFNNIYGNPEKAYHNCVAVRGASIYILGPSHLVVSRLLPWKERIEVLRRAGDWMGALNMAMTLYDGQAHGVIDLPRSLDDVQKTIMPYLAELLLSYVDEVFSYIKVASGNQVGSSDELDDSKSSSDSHHPEIKEQYIRVGGVAVEFCVHIKRTDILFDEIYSKFYAAKQKETFLELLEPYILKDMLGCLPPAIMQALVKHYSMKGWLQRVEQCVLHMDISSLDFNQVVRLCREHRLHGALIYLFNKGLDDFRTPLEELLVVIQHCEKESASALGYRMLVYLKYCFQGLAFPPGHGTLSPTRLLSIRKDILQFLLEDSSTPNSWAVTNLTSNRQFPNLCHLLALDTEATLDVLRCAFVEEERPEFNYLCQESTNLNMEPTEVKDLGDESQNLVQKLVDVLSLIFEASYIRRGGSASSDDGSSFETWPSKKDAGHILDFITYYVACERAKVSRNILSQILEYLTSEISLSPGVSRQNIETQKRREKQLLSLLEVVPNKDWDAPYLLHLCERCQFHQVCGFIHANRCQYLAALDSYMKAVDESIHAFSFIHDMLRRLSETDAEAFQAAVFTRISDLVKLDREGTFFLVVVHFYGQSQEILFSQLQSHPESLFLYLKTLIEVHTTGSLKFSCLRKEGSLHCPSGRRARHLSNRLATYLAELNDFPKLLCSRPIQLTDELTELYLELLCRFEQESVRKFLETFESYRVENCLRLCQEYGIVDAASFLLERVGEVGSALVLILSGLNEKFIMLDTSIGSGPSDSGPLYFNTVLKKKEVSDILDIVHSCIGLCQRNSPRLDPHESEYLWFQLLDSFCMPLMDSCGSKTRSTHQTYMEVLDESLVKQEDEEECKIIWKISKSHKKAHILRKLFSVFIREIVEGMIGYVRLPTIMLKLLSDNGSQEFGDFKPTILGMLGTYDFERRILDTAKSLIEDDTYYTMSLLKKGASHGYAPRGLTCCVCNVLLTKSSHSSSVQVFSCGHAMHAHCELQEDEASVGGSSSGCPICVAGKKPQRSRSKPVLVDNGLVSKASSRQHKVPGTSALHAPENDVFESSYGSHPIARFELLNNLHKDQRSTQIENMPQLRLAPPAVYHEKVKKGSDLTTEESSSGISNAEKSRNKQFRDIKVKGSSVRFPLRSNIFGKEKRSKRSTLG
ncbi:hypothetical protein ACH5RR_024237 [Cinchona calisaya]|uniref:RING-type domain-containing protein n=1 Tax=Cinchona calisaya TaxID=153742 RepID=A0ABD2ZGD2_9GENT